MTDLIVGAIILAGGRSRRFAADKRMAQLPSGTTVLAATIELAARAFDRTVVVLRESEQQLQHQIKVPYVLAPDSDLGMAHSLKAGVRSAASWHGAAIMLADMPFVDPVTLNTLVTRFRDALASGPTIVQPYFEAQPGHPVFFSRDYFAEMLQLKGDEGARRVLQHHLESLIRVDVRDAGVVRDIDTPSDLPTS